MATVTPGITWASGNVLNVANMNLAANPSVVIDTNEVTTVKINDGAVTNAKIASGVDAAKLTTGTLPIARIADGAVTLAKLANVTAGSVVIGNASNVPTATAISGDVTVTSSGVTAIGNAKVTAPMLTGAQTGSAPIYGFRAWVNFNGTSTSVVDGETRCAIRGSGNVSKVVRSGTGTYTVHFTTAMPDANYCVVGMGNRSADVGNNDASSQMSFSGLATGSVNIGTQDNDANSYGDSREVCIAILR